MSVTELNTVLRTLPNLKPAELQQVRGKTGALLSLSGSKLAQMDLGVVETRVMAHIADYLLDGVHHELRRRGLLSRKSGLPNRLIPPNYREASERARQALEEHVGKLVPAEYLLLGQLAARSLATYLENGRVPVSPGTLLNNIGKVPTALAESYPGYLEAGLLSFCWRK